MTPPARTRKPRARAEQRVKAPPVVAASARRATRPAAKLTSMPVARTGRASPAKAALGDAPVLACYASLPQPQRSIAERVDALAAKSLPAVQRCVKRCMAWYGAGDGWRCSCGGFAGHVKLTFGRGTAPCGATVGDGGTRRAARGHSASATGV